MRILRYLLISLAFVVLQVKAVAQSSWLFGTDYDMPNSLVNDITIDANHMVWVATEDGLCKYDGYKFSTYRHRPDDPHSIQANYVRRVFCDKAGHLMIGTRQGLQVYRPATNDFSLLATFEDGSMTKGDVTGFLQRRDGEIWLSGNTTCGVRFDENDTPVLYSTALTNQVDYTEDIVEDSLGYVWVIRRLQELYRMSPQGEVECIRYKGSDVAANTLFCGSDGNVYIGTNSLGLHRYNNQTQNIELVGNDDRCLVREMGHLHDGRMFVATDNVGLMIYDYATKQLTPFTYRSEVLDPATQKVHSACEDEDHNLWLGIYQRGVMMVPENAMAFHLIGSRSREYDVIGDKCITSMFLDRDNLLWITADNGGLYAITCDGKQVKHIDCHAENSQVPFALLSVFEDSKRRLWYGSYNQGFGWVDRNKGTFQSLNVAGIRKESADIYSFAEDKYQRVWAASMGTGLLLFDEATRTMSPAVHSDSCRWNNILRYDEPRNLMYVGSFNGLTIVDVDDPETNPRQLLSTDIVFDMMQLNADTLCLCTGNGIVLFNLNDYTFERYNTIHGLLAGNYYSILPDTLGNIWLGSNVGLTCFNLSSHTSTNFTVFDGLQSNEFSKHATVMCKDNLWFAGSGGITWFNPTEVSRSSSDCEVRLIDIVAGGRSSIASTEFRHDDNTIVLSMGLLPLTKTRQALYVYHLDNDPWTMLPFGTNTVSFSHLSSGNHKFYYKAYISGAESETMCFDFSIQYPWYFRWWAWIIWSALFASVVIYVILTVRQRREDLKRNLRQRHIQAISEAKLQFFTDIAHEIRTPMTLIVGPLSKLMKNDNDSERQRTYNRIMRNSNRILSLMNQLLDVRKLENSQMDLQCQQIAVGEFTTEFCQAFDDVASLRKISLTIKNLLPAKQLAWIDKQQYEKILSNLLSNALKFTPENGSIEVSISKDTPSQKYSEGTIRVMVTDTGMGIPEEAKERVFERFYQEKNAKTTYVGTGIGLYLTRQLMELHHGEVQVEDNPAGKGARFILLFPLGDAHLTESQKLTAEEQIISSDNEMSPVRIAQAILSSDREPVEEKSRRRSHKQKTILLLEDENEVREYFTSDLSQYYKVYSATNGVEGLSELKKHMPDIIISDVMMPEMDGIEFVQQVRQDPRYNQVRIIMLTAKIRDDEKIEGIEVGADAYITKPCSMDVLVATINNLLTSQDRVRTAHNLQPMGSEQVATPEVTNPDNQMLERVIRIINRDLGNSSLTTEAIAQEVGMSRVHLFRKIKDLTGQSPSVYLRNIRLSKAAEIIASGEATMSDVASAVGFENQGAFSSAFKDLFGMSPTQYKQLQRNPRQEEN